MRVYVFMLLSTCLLASCATKPEPTNMLKPKVEQSEKKSLWQEFKGHWIPRKGGGYFDDGYSPIDEPYFGPDKSPAYYRNTHPSLW